MLSVALLQFFFLPNIDAATPLEEARTYFYNGRYLSAIRLCNEAIKDDQYPEEWRLMLIQSYMHLGQYTNALGALTNAMERYPSSIRMRLLGTEVCRFNGQKAMAESMLQDIGYLASTRTWAYREPADLVALGRASVLLGAEPRRVLDLLFERAKRADPKLRDTYLATGQLALDKGDYELASKAFAEGLKHNPDDADLHYGIARAFAPSDRRQMLRSLAAALEGNTNHVQSYLLLADHLVDGEDYDEASEVIEKALAVNPWHPEAWAYRAIIAHLHNEPEAESKARETALKYYADNPQVDHLIGRKLSQKYRFAEGAACQRRALVFDSSYLPAKIQLAQDLLRLGEETEGWQLANEVHRQDAYDITAFNLVTLNETIGKFKTITNQDFVVRMSAKEAQLYGDRVLRLLNEAKKTLTAKYKIDLETPIYLEIFPEQKDFGVRTFGMPDNPGFLGVCFGRVITANSPASQGGHPANWEAVVWHEFCHVITLQLTRNKMPRWLSEGISVYEERQANPTWGQSITPKYREMILGKDFVPISKLSAAFLSPKTDLHLQFAYYQSSLVVEYLVKNFGLAKVQSILLELREGTEITKALEKHTRDLEEVEKEFEAFARARAESLGPKLDWTKTEPDEELAIAPAKPAANSYYGLLEEGKSLVKEKKWQEAKKPLQTLVDSLPDQSGAEGALAMLASAHRALKETNQEIQVLERLAKLDADATEAFLRLMELYADGGNWKGVSTNAERFLAVNPLLPAPYRFLAMAAEQLNNSERAIEACEKMLLLDPPDPADTHFRLARLLQEKDTASAKRHLLQALEEAPRFREAHQLLLKMNANNPPPKEATF